jgi:hypothetical protein
MGTTLIHRGAALKSPKSDPHGNRERYIIGTVKFFSDFKNTTGV